MKVLVFCVSKIGKMHSVKVPFRCGFLLIVFVERVQCVQCVQSQVQQEQ